MQWGDKKHELNVSTYHMCILLLFNEADKHSYRDILAATGIPSGDLKRALQSLALVKVGNNSCNDCSACVQAAMQAVACADENHADADASALHNSTSCAAHYCCHYMLLTTALQKALSSLSMYFPMTVCQCCCCNHIGCV